MADAKKAQKGAEKIGKGILPRTAAILKNMRERIEEEKKWKWERKVGKKKKKWKWRRKTKPID